MPTQKDVILRLILLYYKHFQLFAKLKTFQRYRNVPVKNETYQQLVKLGNLEDSFDSVISRLLEHKRKKKNSAMWIMKA